MKASLKKIAGMIDLRDALVFGGLGVLCTGVAQIYPPAAWIVGGAALMWIGLR